MVEVTALFFPFACFLCVEAGADDESKVDQKESTGERQKVALPNVKVPLDWCLRERETIFYIVKKQLVILHF